MWLRLSLLLALILTTQSMAQEKKALDHDAYELWNRTNAQGISNNAKWIFLSIGPEQKDSELHIKSLTDDRVYIIPRGESPRFDNNNQYLATLVKAFKDSVKQAKEDKKKPEESPKDSLAIITLETGDTLKIGRVKSFKMPKEGGDVIAYLLEKKVIEKKDSTDVKQDSTEVKKEEGTSKTKSEEEQLKPETKESEKQEETKKPEETQKEEKSTEAKEEEKKEDKKKDRKKSEGTELVLRNLKSGKETRYAHVVSYHLSEDGKHLVYAAASKDSTADGLYAINTNTRDSVAILTGPADYKKITLHEKGDQLTFVTNRDSFGAEQQEYTLYHWKTKAKAPTQIAKFGTRGIPSGWWVSEHGNLAFSKDGKKLFFGTAPKPEIEKEDETPKDEKVVVDIWNWKDPYLQPMQLKDLKDEKNRSYRAVVHLSNNKIVQLATPDIPDIRLGSEGNAKYVIGTSIMPYRQLISWDSPAYYDSYLIDTQTGQKTKMHTKLQARPSFSPESKYLYWWDGVQKTFFVQNIKSGNRINAGAQIPHALHNEFHDRPMPANNHGTGGWTKGDKDFLIYDRFDIWRTDPTGKKSPINITEGIGRKTSNRFRYVSLDPDERARNPKSEWLLSSFNLKTKADGYYRDRLEGNQEPQKLIQVDKDLNRLRKAKDADVFFYTQSSFHEYPDMWISDNNFQNARKVTDINPQQKDYLWGTSELVEWTSLDGENLQGILCKPEGFDPSQKYPMVVFYYERYSQLLHNYWAPSPGRSVINMSLFVSKGYLIFIPDIPYKIGYPGESAVNAIVPGVTQLIDKGFVDKKRVGIIGHSWSGYQTAYILTRSNLFAAAEAGAPVSNMTSAYGGIRWGSGLSRMMQYERSQSRIGGSLWKYPNRYIENSPIFWADKIQTPLLMMHNDNDGAVPWYQGIEMFVAMRRLGKPAWLINYNGEEHGLRKYHNRKDWAIRMQQFFDHYLTDAPAPVWMIEGVPAIKKGKTLGLELIE
ncbi:MAG: prolyl oligopeptidase family serine peptidase [Candidatus Latescibacteria bacterium]|jgi:dienelactone hydrolase|nr:prolyl oligopeptidase family serine peptidase [Candidatus Latescibacterota bacterium]MBT4138882.1 prolyl oligopeptidase family serine peptidase [Candidatus Latescibacterota bacterium]